jgi:hypothetical protein
VFNTYRDSLNWQNDLTLNDRNSLILGGDWYEDRIHSSTTSPKTAAGTAPRSSSIASTANGSPPNWACATTRTSSLAARTAGAAPSPCR